MLGVLPKRSKVGQAFPAKNLEDIFVEENSKTFWAQCYKTFFTRNLRIFVIS
jgi:hypothetical protein